MIKRLLIYCFLLLIPVLSGAQTYLMSNTTVNTCGGTFYDSGGQGGQYGNNENSTMTFCSGIAGNCVRLQFTTLNVERGYDSLYIYNGPSAASPLLAALSGNIGTATYTA